MSEWGEFRDCTPTFSSTIGERSIAMQEEKHGEELMKRLEEEEAKYVRKAPRFARR